MLLADGPSVNISIMAFRAHPQKFTNSFQHRAKLNNTATLELWKGDIFPNIKADWLFTTKTSAGLNCWILIQAGTALDGEMLCPSCRLDHRKVVDWLVNPLILLAYSSAHITSCNWNSQPWPCFCDLSPWLILLSILSFVSSRVAGLTVMHASLEEPQLVLSKFDYNTVSLFWMYPLNTGLSLRLKDERNHNIHAAANWGRECNFWLLYEKMGWYVSLLCEQSHKMHLD